MLIEQAIFASAATDRAKGYQLVARSSGLDETAAGELAVWGPSHDSLLELPGGSVSVNFHRLTGGDFCVSRTSQSGSEFSGRGGAGVYTQFLVVPAPVLARFANNPFAILRAATAAGHMGVHDQIPDILEPLRLGGRCAVADLPLLAQLTRHPGPAAMATFIQAALSSDRLAVAADVPLEHLIAGLFSALPVECREQFSFSTGLRFSPRRDVRMTALSDDRASWRAIARAGFTLLSLEDTEHDVDVCWRGWAGFVAENLAASTLSSLAGELEQARPGLTCADLDALAAAIQVQHPHDEPQGQQAAPEGPDDRDVTGEEPEWSGARRADGAHLASGPVLATTPNPPGDNLTLAAPAQRPETVELIERIDDLVFAAIAGDQQALAELEMLWPTIASELGPDVVEQSREQYLRCALGIWSECVEGPVHRPERAVAAIDVLCVLFDE